MSEQPKQPEPMREDKPRDTSVKRHKTNALRSVRNLAPHVAEDAHLELLEIRP